MGLLETIRNQFVLIPHVQCGGLSEGMSQLLAAGLAHDIRADKLAGVKHLVIVLPTAKEITPWAHFVGGTIPALWQNPSSAATGEERPPFSILPFLAGWGADRFVNNAVFRRQRSYSLSLLAAGTPCVILTTAAALAQLTLPKSALQGLALNFAEGDEWDQDELVRHLEDMGYRGHVNAEEEGNYALRGGILDIYPVNYGLPIRIEFIGDSIGSMRFFSPENQRSLDSIAAAQVFPVSEVQIPSGERRSAAQKLYDFLLDQPVSQHDREGIVSQCREGLRFPGFDLLAPILRDESVPTLDYCKNSLFLFPSGIDPCLASTGKLFDEWNVAHERDLTQERVSLPLERHFLALDRLGKDFSESPYVEIGNPIQREGVSQIRMAARQVIEGAPPPQRESKDGGDMFDKWLARINTHVRNDSRPVALFAHHQEQLDRAAHLFEHRTLPTEFVPNLVARVLQGSLADGRIYLGLGEFTGHFWNDENHLLVLPEPILFGSNRRKSRPQSSKLQNLLSSFRDLKVGDLVVHVQHGIARYQGLTSFEISGTTGDFLVLEFAGGDRIYVPVDRLSLLQRYSSGIDESGSGAGHPALDKLRSNSWEKRKGRVKKAVRDMADELLKLQAKRAVSESHICSAPGDSYFQFEAEFPYEETEDQIRAIQDVNTDLGLPRPMDRLICGDVGFGKTEVAIRAAYRMVLDGYQVLILVPTTILCYQHYRTFSARLSQHGVKVAQVNRFVRGPELQDAIKGLEEGRVDVLVGTHRILSSDIKPKRMGLMIVDEEQRFGVVHKEKLKNLRAGAHILTLSATPIPRTLHMAMLGLRDISIIATPPHDRLAVKSLVVRFDESIIRDAIHHELQRGGQVFVVHNRVEDIEEFTTFIKSLVPKTEVRFAHGQMSEHQLEKTIVDFLDQKFPVLVCTSIIESGVDMPHVNTLIVDRADRFGLAQLYQLKGRVGRSSEQAYAYMLTPGDERLSEDAMKRLDVLGTHQELGAGFQIASYDLELRGAGNLLGGDQSGHASEIGLELYTHMLESAINEIRGTPTQETVDTELRIPVTAVIPITYIANEGQRLHTYKRLFSAADDEDLRSIQDEARDRFGPPPVQFIRLIKVALLKIRLKALNVLSFSSGDRKHFEAKFAALTEAQAKVITEAARTQSKRFRLSPDYRLTITPDLSKKSGNAEAKNDSEEQMLDGLIACLDPLVHNLAKC